MKLKYFKLARRMASYSDHHTHKIGCVVVKKNRVISTGYNKLKTHPKSPHKYNTIHAEFDALVGLGLDKTTGAEVYIYRELKNGSMATSKPCNSCLSILHKLSIAKVHYTVYNGYNTESL